MAAYWTPQGLQKLAQSESTGQADLIHYPSGYAPNGKPSSASGLYGFLDSTWREQAANVPGASQYERAYQAPASVQTAVAAQTPISHWTCLGCNSTAVNLSYDPSNVTSTPSMGGDFTTTDNGSTFENVGNFGFEDQTKGTAFETSLGVNGDQLPATENTGSGDILSDPNTGQSVGPMFGQKDSGSGLAFHPTSGIPTESIVTGISVAKSAILAGVPDVTKALGNVGAAIDGVGSTFASWVSQGIAAAEETIGRSMVMLLAIVLVLAAAWLLVPRSTKEAVVATAAKAV